MERKKNHLLQFFFVVDIMRILLAFSYFSTYSEIWSPPNFPLLYYYTIPLFTYFKLCFLEWYPFIVKMDPEKWQNKAHISKTIRTKWNFWNTRQLESIHLSAINGTFVKKGEIKSNFLTTPTHEPKLNHWVNTILIQFKPWSRCILKVTFIFTFFF